MTQSVTDLFDRLSDGSDRFDEQLEDLFRAREIECCSTGTVCSICGRPTCLEHSDPPPVNCENDGLVCANCHQACVSIRCAREHADPDA